ncbi:AAA family ATPase [Halodesulfovibrio aestuarii]|uniref:AAA family ATPase n=1 Tax=Halodesulfovibrio aestuarii TaxID=126333 RepID=UPI000421CFC7
MIQAEYLRFMQTLNVDAVSVDVRRMANLVNQHLDMLIPLSTHQGQRVKRVSRLAQIGWGDLSSDIQPLTEFNVEQSLPIISLKSLTVGPFRGFAREEIFDLLSQLVLIYGPNGTGKSSFCEALEFGLLGSVAEAESKRFRDQNEYLANARTGKLDFPEIVGVDSEGNEVSVPANESLFRFCFVEKNRIHNFSRIAAQLPAKQTELISSLFGLDSFNDFVRNFSAVIDGKYIDLVGVKAKQLEEKRKVLASEQQLVENAAEDLKKFVAEEDLLAKSYRDGVTFAQMVVEINGDEKTSGKIAQLDTELQQPVLSKLNVTYAELITLQQSVEKDLSELNEKLLSLNNASQDVSFKQLYEAVVQLETVSSDRCPTCRTLLVNVAQNPFALAKGELEKLSHLDVLQKEVTALNRSIVQSLSRIHEMLSLACTNFSSNPLIENLLTQQETLTIQWWQKMFVTGSDGYTPWQHLDAQVKQLEERDLAIGIALQQRKVKVKELSRLRSFAKQVTIRQTLKSHFLERVKKAKAAIESFDKENKVLIAEVKNEKKLVVQNQIIVSAYSQFVEKLVAYKESLPLKLVEDLGEKVVTLYNAFNRNDAPKDLLANIRLPLSQNERLKIAFQSEPTKFFDALHVLSEGHIRCIGLAILLAKNLKEECSLLIFDDPVNAIDDDHREAIRRTLFEEDLFSDKQIILTCHGEEFFKDIQNLLPAERAVQSKAVTFLPQLDEQHIRVDFNCAPRNYIIAARSHFDREEIRGALAKSRQALESLTKGKVWRYVSKYGDGNLSIKLRSATSPIELRNLTEQLRKQINKRDFDDLNKSAVLIPIETLLGMNGDSREWRYLNKGTHDEVDRVEFDRGTVNTLVAAIEQIDNALAAFRS